MRCVPSCSRLEDHHSGHRHKGTTLARQHHQGNHLCPKNVPESVANSWQTPASPKVTNTLAGAVDVATCTTTGERPANSMVNPAIWRPDRSDRLRPAKPGNKPYADPNNFHGVTRHWIWGCHLQTCMRTGHHRPCNQPPMTSLCQKSNQKEVPRNQASQKPRKNNEKMRRRPPERNLW